MAYFWATLIANSITLAVAITAAILRPVSIYRLIAGAATLAFLFALHQVITGQSNLFVLLSNALLVALLMRRNFMNARNVKQSKR